MATPQVISFSRETHSVRNLEIKYALIYIRGDFERGTSEQMFASRVIYALDDQPNTGGYAPNGQDFILNLDLTKEEIIKLKSEYDIIKEFFEDQIVISKDQSYSLEDYIYIYQEESAENFDLRLHQDWIVPRDISKYFPYKSIIVIDDSLYRVRSARLATEPSGAYMMVVDAQMLSFYNGVYGLDMKTFKYHVSAFTDDDGVIDIPKLPMQHASEFLIEGAVERGKEWLSLTKGFHVKHVEGILSYRMASNSHFDGVENMVAVNGNCIIDFSAVPGNFGRLGYQYDKKYSGFEHLEESDVAAHLAYHNTGIPCFYKGVQICGYVDINSLSDPKFDVDLLSKVIIPNKFKEKIGNSLGAFSADLNNRKGSTKLFVLAGPTGTGKTLTATAFAENRSRIMIYVSAGTLGSDPANIERSLGAYMELAQRWGADMLLDEGDVYITKRSNHDLIRNQIVAIFLTHLEKYNVVMYLTTNRASSIDPAIMSRVTLFLRYKKMNYKDFIKIIKLSCEKVNLKIPDTSKIKILSMYFVFKNIFSKKKINGRRINKIIEGVYGDINTGDTRSFFKIFIERMRYSE